MPNFVSPGVYVIEKDISDFEQGSREHALSSVSPLLSE